MEKLFNSMGLGTFPFAGPFGKIEESDAKMILNAFLDRCGKYIDVAPTYAFGKIEELLGDVFQRHSRDQFFVNTSCGYVRQGDKFVVSGKFDDVLDDCAASLQRLKLDAIDLYISHIPDVNTPFSETVSAMRKLKEEGKIKHIGVSNVTLDQLKAYNKDGDIEFVQNRFSLLNQSIDQQFMDYLLENNVGLVAYQVLDRGLLTNHMLDVFTLQEGDLRNTKPEFSNNVVNTIAGWVRSSLKPIADRYGISVTTLAIKWAQHQPFVAMCQCGATRLSQLEDFERAVNKDVPDNFYAEVDSAYRELTADLKKKYGQTVRQFMGLESYNLYSGSASGK